MKKQIFLISTLLVTTALLLGIVSCKKDSTPTFALSTLTAGSIDMNGANPPTDVPPNPTIIAVFNIDVSAATVNSTTVTLVRDYDQASIPMTYTVNGQTVTIVPDEDLGNGTLYTLTFGAGVLATDGQALTPLTRAFTTIGTFVPSGVFAYWDFNDNANDVLGNYPAATDGVIDIFYGNSFTDAAKKAASFNGTTSIIEIPNAESLTNTDEFTLAFWVKPDSNFHPQGYFVMGLGAYHGFQFEISGDVGSCKLAATYDVGTGTASQDLWFNGDGKYNANGGYVGWTFCKDLTANGGVKALLANKWSFIVCRYSAATKIATMYINGEKMKEQDYHLYDNVMTGALGLKWDGVAPDVYPTLAFGFIQSREGTLWSTEPWGGYTFPGANHFKGYLDEIRIFHKALTEQEIQLMYDSAKP